MAFDGKHVVAKDGNSGARDTAVNAYFCCWQAHGRTSAGVSFELECVDMRFVCHGDEEEYLC